MNPAADVARAAVVRRAFVLGWLTVGWMVIEATVALRSGVAAHSLTLSAFGIDSIIELASAGVLLWRLRRELSYGRGMSEHAEHIATRIGGGSMGGSTGHTPFSRVNRPHSFAPWSRYSKLLNQVVSKSLTRPGRRVFLDGCGVCERRRVGRSQSEGRRCTSLVL
jgi:hypothetical protein